MNYSSRFWKTSLTAVGLAAVLLAGAGCTRRVAVTHWFGLFRSRAPRAARVKLPPAANQPARLTPDDRLRETLVMQSRGAFNPLTDDRRVQLLNARLKLDPQNVAARLELAAILERYRLCDEALEQYTRALNLEPSEKAATGVARTARGAGHGRDALGVLAAFVKTEAGASAAEAWNELGILREEAGEHTAAEQAFRRAAALVPTAERFHNNLGYNLLLQGRLVEAETALRQALELKPGLAVARNNFGMVLARRGNLNGAREQFLAAADPATAHNNLAVVLMEMGDYDASRAELVKALQARHYFQPAIDNFKLVQELLRQRADLVSAGNSLPLSSLRVPNLVPSGKPQSQGSENHP